MIPDTIIIAGSAASVGFIHTILGPDHYLPLVAMAKTNGWSGTKDCKLHCFLWFQSCTWYHSYWFPGLSFRSCFFSIETVQTIRGDFAGWFLLLFGAIYFAWGVRWVIRKKQIKSRC